MSRAEYLRPSSAATWVVCNGYAAMRAAYPQAPDEADDDVREDGIACHWLAAELLFNKSPALGSISSNGRVLTEEMFDACDEYITHIKSWGVPATIETSLNCAYIIVGMTGTPDAWAYDPIKRVLYIVDLKFGFRFIEVWENWQLVLYVGAILDHLGMSGLDELSITVQLTIVQPRSYHRDGTTRTWRVKASDLRGQWNILRNAAAMATCDVAPACTPNPGCGDCPARHACTALQQSSLVALETSYAGLPLELPPAAVGDELRRLKAANKNLEARINGLEVQAESLLKSGKVVPGWSLEASYARERWQDGVESQVLILGRYYNADLAKPATPVTPAAARKLIPAEVVAMYSHKPSTGVRLTKQDPFQAKKKFTQPE